MDWGLGWHSQTRSRVGCSRHAPTPGEIPAGAPAGPPKATPGPSGLPPPPSATFFRLCEFIAKRMRMSHIDQPLMLMELLGH
jgi:hypothetical protein